MALFDKCRAFCAQLEPMRSVGQFFYLREMNPPATPVVTVRSRKMVMLGSNNYLGLANHPRVIEATVAAVREHGAGACSSRILAGTTSLHTALEKRLAEFKRAEDAVVFSTGFMTMMGTIAALAGKDDLILGDELNHASIVDGCRLSRAQHRIYRHNDMANLEAKLAAFARGGNTLIVTDGVFSMRGTVANIPEIKRLADRYGARVMVDDAHGTGVLGEHGRGILEHFHMENQIDLLCGTFSKTLGTIGGFTAAARDVVTFLRLHSRPFIFTASPPPSVMATVLACLDVMDSEPQWLEQLRRNTEFLKRELKTLGFRLDDTITPIIPIRIGDPTTTFRMVGDLEKEGVIVNAVVPPALPPGEALVRVSVIATLTTGHLCQALDAFRRVGRRLALI